METVKKMKFMLKIVRKFNKFIMATGYESRMIERMFKSKQVYNYLDVPDQMFRSKSREVVKY